MKILWGSGARKIIASFLAASVAVAMTPSITGSVTVFADDEVNKNDSNTCLGTSAILAPEVPSDADSDWTGSYVSFGKEDFVIIFRVLSPNTDAYGGTTMLLESDESLFKSAFDDDSVSWEDSQIRDYLNGEFLTGGTFGTLEQAAIYTSSGDGGLKSDDDSYIPVSINDKIFILDRTEVMNPEYGYYPSKGSSSPAGTDGVNNRAKGGADFKYWLRSFKKEGSGNSVDSVSPDGIVGGTDITSSVGVVPALNIDLSYVIFSSVSPLFSRTVQLSEVGASYSLTLLDNELDIAVPDGKEITISGSSVTVPYQISGADSGNATRASVLILDNAYGTSGAKILYYDGMSGDFSNTEETAGTFTLPSSLDKSGWGTDYYVYILAEDINGDFVTDYACEPVAVGAPKEVEITYTVSFEQDGEGTVSADVTSGATGTVVALTATPDSGYVFKEWQVVSGNVTIIDNKFTIGEEDVVVRAIFEKEDRSGGSHTAIPASGESYAWTLTAGGICIAAAVILFAFSFSRYKRKRVE